MTTPNAIPIPPNNNMDRGIFVWTGDKNDPIASNRGMGNVISCCITNNANVVFLDVQPYLVGSALDATGLTRLHNFVNQAHANGIRVMAMAGIADWGHNQSWVMNNFVRNLSQFQSVSYATGSGFDAVLLNVQYWTMAGYTSVEPIGVCDLMNSMRKVLNMPIGAMVAQSLVNPGMTVTYDGYTGAEGYVLMRNADFCTVQCFSNVATTQESDFQNWFNYASQPGLGLNVGLYCVSMIKFGQPVGTSYYGQTKTAMEVNHTAISNYFTAPPNTNSSFLGQAIDDYATYIRFPA